MTAGRCAPTNNTSVSGSADDEGAREHFPVLEARFRGSVVGLPVLGDDLQPHKGSNGRRTHDCDA